MEFIKVKIKEFGRVKNSHLEILPFVIFSGESGLGKSYVALLCHYFYEVLISSSRLTHFFENNGYDYKELSKEFHNEGIALEIQKNDLEKWLAEDAINYVGMMLGNDALSGSIEVSLPSTVPSKLIFRFKEELTGLVNEEKVDIILSMEKLSYRVNDAILAEETPFSFLLRFELINYLFGNFRNLNTTFVFPPSRGPILTEILTPQTGIYSHFLQDLNELNLRRAPTQVSQDLLQLFHEILEGDIKRIDNKYFYQVDNMDNPIPISAAAASIREIAPLEMLARKVDVSTSSVLFEEPEAHLHPLKQRMMADILSAFANARCFMQVTTHSDYLIRRLNELILLNKIREREDEEKFNSLCEEIGTSPKLSLDVAKIAAYILRLNNDGSSYIERQNIEDGISYLSFSEAIDRSMEVQRRLGELLDDTCE